MSVSEVYRLLPLKSLLIGRFSLAWCRQVHYAYRFYGQAPDVSSFIVRPGPKLVGSIDRLLLTYVVIIGPPVAPRPTKLAPNESLEPSRF